MNAWLDWLISSEFIWSGAETIVYWTAKISLLHRLFGRQRWVNGLWKTTCNTRWIATRRIATALNRNALNCHALNCHALNRHALNRNALNCHALNRHALNRHALNRTQTQILSRKSSSERAETIGNGSVMSDLPKKLPFVLYFSLRDLWRFFQKYHFFTNFAFFLRGGVCNFHNFRKSTSISTSFGYVVVPVGSLGGSMVSTPADQSATSSRGPKSDFFAFFVLEDRRTFLRWARTPWFFFPPRSIQYLSNKKGPNEIGWAWDEICVHKHHRPGQKKRIFFTDHGILVGIRHRLAPKLSEMEAPCLIYPKSFHLFRIFR